MIILGARFQLHAIKDEAFPASHEQGTTPGQTSAGTPTSASGESDTPHLDRSESDAVNTLAGLAATGAAWGEGSEGPDPKGAQS